MPGPVAGFKWHGPEFTRFVEREMRLRLRAASEVVKARAVKLLSISVFEKTVVDHVRVFRRIRGRNTTSIKEVNRVDVVRSKPGEPPRAETSTLRKSVHYEVAYAGELRARVGTNVKYGLYLQLGVRRKGAGNGRWKIAPRPWLDVALGLSRERVVRILTRPLPKKP